MQLIDKIRHKNWDILDLSQVSQLIYPPVCGICGNINKNSLCNKCEMLLNKEAKFIIEKNQNSRKNFDEYLYIFQYEGIIRKMILDYKFNDKSYLYKTFVNFLLKNEKFFKILESYDTIIPVPISKKRKKVRGYNQSYLISKELSKLTKLECITDCLFKKKDIIEQSKLSKEERLLNIEDVYEIHNKEKLENKKVILFDDIYTTGSTVNECCKVLRQAKIAKIGVLTIAKD